MSELRALAAIPRVILGRHGTVSEEAEPAVGLTNRASGKESPYPRGSPRTGPPAARLSVTQAYPLPRAPNLQNLPARTVPIEPVVLHRLRTEAPGSGLHLALVDVVRRQYKLAAQTADRA